METRFTKAIATTIIVLIAFSAFSVALAQNNSVSYKLLDEQTGMAAYTLNIVVPQSLLEYYQEKNHQIYSPSEFAKFVTPYAVKPVADSLREIYPNDEDFANAALSIVHQMTYVETVQGKYPAETLIDGIGDCDIFSFVAASIMKAGGLDIVLLHYEDKKHMNIGVHLTNPPEDARTGVYKFTRNGIPYYIAEATGGNWTTGWRVGECPDNLKQAEAQVLTLENAEQVAPGQVSASFTTLENSDLSLEISPPFTIENSMITLRGSLIPGKPNENVTIYLAENGYPWAVLGTAVTKQDGSFTYTWKSEKSGLYGLRASWTGDETYASSTSLTQNATVIPIFLLLLIVVAVVAVVVGAVAIVSSRHTNAADLELKEPQPPTFQ